MIQNTEAGTMGRGRPQGGRAAAIVAAVLIGSALATAVAGIFLSRAEAQMAAAISLGVSVVGIYRRGIRLGWWEGTESLPLWLWAIGGTAVALYFSAWGANGRSVRSTRLIGMVIAGTLALALTTWRGREEAIARKWARSRGLHLGSEGASALESYLRRKARFRAASVVFYVGAIVLARSLGLHAAAFSLAVSAIFFGVSQLEVLAIEITHRPPRPTAGGAAVLAVRTVDQHVPRRSLGLVRALGAATLVLMFVYLVVPGSETTYGVAGILWFAAAGCLVALGCELAQRLRVRMAEPFVSDELWEIEEAIRRSWARESISGALAALALVVGVEIWAIGHASGVAWLATALGYAAFVVAGGAFLYAQVVAYQELKPKAPSK